MTSFPIETLPGKYLLKLILSSICIYTLATVSLTAQVERCDCTAELSKAPAGLIRFIRNEIGEQTFQQLPQDRDLLERLGFGKCPGATFNIKAPGICRRGAVTSSGQGLFRNKLRVTPKKDGMYLFTSTSVSPYGPTNSEYTIHVARILDDAFLETDVRDAIEEQLGLDLVEGRDNTYRPAYKDPLALLPKVNSSNLGARSWGASDDHSSEHPDCQPPSFFLPAGLQWNGQYFQLRISVHNTADPVRRPRDQANTYIEYKFTFLDRQMRKCRKHAQELHDAAERGETLKID